MIPEDLSEEIDNQPVININELLWVKRSKEDRLPKRFRRGWEL